MPRENLLPTLPMATRRHIAPDSFAFTLLLGALSALPPLSIDMGLPAMPALARALGASPAAAGLTLSLFVAGFAMAQLLFGPLSDRFGRRPVLQGGCLLFALAGVFCSTAGSIAAVDAWRFVQGAGGGAGTVLALAIVRDLFTGAAARTRLSYVTMVLSIAPIVAPTLGGLLLPLGGWRAIYAALALGGLLLTAAVGLGFAESNLAPDPQAMDPQRLWQNYRAALTSLRCSGNAAVGGLVMGGMFAYVAASPLVLLGIYHVSTSVYGMLFALTAGSIMAGAFLSGRLAKAGLQPVRPLAWGLGVGASAALLLLLVASMGTPPLAVLMPLLICTTFSMGLTMPNLMHAAIEGMPQSTGVAAALTGCIRMLGAAASSALVSALFPLAGLVALPMVMALFFGGALVLWWTLPHTPLPGE